MTWCTWLYVKNGEIQITYLKEYIFKILFFLSYNFPLLRKYSGLISGHSVQCSGSFSTAFRKTTLTIITQVMYRKTRLLDHRYSPKRVGPYAAYPEVSGSDRLLMCSLTRVPGDYPATSRGARRQLRLLSGRPPSHRAPNRGGKGDARHLDTMCPRHKQGRI